MICAGDRVCGGIGQPACNSSATDETIARVDERCTEAGQQCPPHLNLSIYREMHHGAQFAFGDQFQNYWSFFHNRIFEPTMFSPNEVVAPSSRGYDEAALVLAIFEAIKSDHTSLDGYSSGLRRLLFERNNATLEEQEAMYAVMMRVYQESPTGHVRGAVEDMLKLTVAGSNRRFGSLYGMLSTVTKLSDRNLRAKYLSSALDRLTLGLTEQHYVFHTELSEPNLTQGNVHQQTLDLLYSFYDTINSTTIPRADRASLMDKLQKTFEGFIGFGSHFRGELRDNIAGRFAFLVKEASAGNVKKREFFFELFEKVMNTDGYSPRQIVASLYQLRADTSDNQWMSTRIDEAVGDYLDNLSFDNLKIAFRTMTDIYDTPTTTDEVRADIYEIFESILEDSEVKSDEFIAALSAVPYFSTTNNAALVLEETEIYQQNGIILASRFMARAADELPTASSEYGNADRILTITHAFTDYARLHNVWANDLISGLTKRWTSHRDEMSWGFLEVVAGVNV